MSRSDKIKAVFFCLLAAAFFAVPWCWKAARDWAPGIAVLAGIAFSVFIGNPLQRWTSKVTSPLLGATIVGMGFGMNLIDVLKAGGSGFIYTVIGISAGIGLGVLIGKRLGLTRDSMYLISVGTSICGGSAIAAAAPVLKAKSHDIALASATIFALNAIALLVFPEIGRFLGFSQEQFGFWAALGIHDTSSVVGAGLAYGDTALEVGTTVKLARALWIVPVTLFLSLFIADRDPGEGRKVKIKIPWFIPCFLAAAALVTWIPCTAGAGKFIKEISKYLMVTTLFLIGANLSREKLKELGIRPIIHGILLWLILASGWCFAIWKGWVVCDTGKTPPPAAVEQSVQPPATPESPAPAPAPAPAPRSCFRSLIMTALLRLSRLLTSCTSPIIIAVSLLTFWQPQLFMWVKGDRQTVVLGIIMLTMGMTLKPQDFTILLKRPLDLAIGACAQYTLMPLLALGLVHLFNLPTGIAVGLMLVGCCPGGVSSNLITFLSKGDIAFSVGMTTVSTLLSPLLTPFIMLYLAGNRIDIQAAAMLKSILIVTLLPIGIGLLGNLLWGKSPRYRALCDVMPGLSVIAFACIVGGVISWNGERFFDSGLWIFLGVFLHNALGYLTGYLAALAARMPSEKRRTVAIEVGIQNAGLATNLATRHFPALPEAAIASAVSCVWHSVSGTLIAGCFMLFDSLSGRTRK